MMYTHDFHFVGTSSATQRKIVNKFGGTNLCIPFARLFVVGKPNWAIETCHKDQTIHTIMYW